MLARTTRMFYTPCVAATLNCRALPNGEPQLVSVYASHSRAAGIVRIAALLAVALPGMDAIAAQQPAIEYREARQRYHVGGGLWTDNPYEAANLKCLQVVHTAASTVTRDPRYPAGTNYSFSCKDHYLYPNTIGKTTWCPAGYRRGSSGSGANFVDYCYRFSYDPHPEVETGRPDHCVGNPINVETGRKFQSETDYLSIANPLMSFVRYYNSSISPAVDVASFSPLSTPGPAGEWTHSFSSRLVFADDVTTPSVSYIEARRPDGRRMLFVRSDGDPQIDPHSSNPTSARLLPPGFSDAGVSTGTGYALVLASGRIEYFDATGKLEAVVDGEYDVSMEYDAAGLLSGVVSSGGHRVTLEYADYAQSLAPNNTDPVATVTTLLDRIVLDSGVAVEYAYAGVRTSTMEASVADDQLPFVSLASVRYGDGSTLAYEYDDAGRLVGIVDELGVRSATWAYDGRGRTTLSEHAGGVDRVSIDYAGNGTGDLTITNALGKQSAFENRWIKGRYRLESVSRLASPNCGASARSLTYDSEGRVATRTGWEGSVTRFEYSADNRLVSVVEADGTTSERQSSTTWNATHGRPTLIDRPRKAMAFAYDGRGNVLDMTESDRTSGEVRATSFQYDVRGRLVSVDGPRTDVADVTTIAYWRCSAGGKCGEISTITDALGHVTEFTDYDALRQPTRIVERSGRVIELAYDARQRVIRSTSAGRATSYEHDPRGGLISLTDPDGRSVTYERDDAGRLIGLADARGNRIDWTLDAAGNRTEERIQDPTGTLRKSARRAYDELSRLITLTHAHGGTDSYSYDDNGDVTAAVDPGGRSTVMAYDPLRRLVRQIDPTGGETQFVYDRDDSLLSVIDPEGRTTSYAYNGFGDLLSQTSPDTGTTTYTVDAAGNRTSSTDARGVTIAYAYDALNRLVSATYPDASESIGYEYDQGANGIGRLSALTNASGRTEYEYNARGNVVAVRSTVDGRTHETRYSWNEADRLIGMTYPSGRTIAYALDATGQVASVTATAPDGTSETIASGVTRLPFGPITALTLGNGIVRQRAFDQDYRPTSLVDGQVLSRGYVWSDVDTIDAITDGIDLGAAQFLEHDALDRLTFAAGAYGELAYGYDGIGNRTVAETREEDGTLIASVPYGYAPGSHRLTSVGSRALAHDAAGNTVADGSRSFAYSDRGRLESATVDGRTSTYAHDAAGRRVRKTLADGTTIHYVHDLQGRLIAEAGGEGTVTVEYAWLEGEPLTMWREALEPPQPDTPPTAPDVVAPIGASDTATPTYTWSAVDDADRYQLIVYDRSTRSRIHRGNYTAASICEAECSVAPAGATLGFAKNHHWRVRARNAAGWGAWSARARFDYLDAPPGPVSALAPIGVTETTATPTYRWEALGNAEQYQMHVYDRAARSRAYLGRHAASAVCETPQGTCSLKLPDVPLGDSTRHYWRVRARNATGWGPWSARQAFGTAASRS